VSLTGGRFSFGVRKRRERKREERETDRGREGGRERGREIEAERKRRGKERGRRGVQPPGLSSLHQPGRSTWRGWRFFELYASWEAYK
jgi:hypothetical protein